MTVAVHGVKGLNEMIEEVRRLSGEPSFRITKGLEMVLASAFAKTQAQVHVLTSSLKQSGKTFTTWDSGKNEWQGRIEYGGVSAGPINPVDYAMYEKARGSGPPFGKGSHDFFAGLDEMAPMYVDALMEWFHDQGRQ